MTKKTANQQRDTQNFLSSSSCSFSLIQFGYTWSVEFQALDLPLAAIRILNRKPSIFWIPFLMSLCNLFQSAISCSISFSFSTQPQDFFGQSSQYQSSQYQHLVVVVVVFRLFGDNSFNRFKFLGRISSICIANFPLFRKLPIFKLVKFSALLQYAISKYVGTNPGQQMYLLAEWEDRTRKYLAHDQEPKIFPSGPT